MAPRLIIRFCFAGLLATAFASPAAAQFNPQGRSKKPKPSVRAEPRARPPSKPATGTPSSKPAPQADKPDAKANEPSTEALIARYTAIVVNQPGADFPLQRLAELYRQRDGKVDALLADLEKRAAGAQGKYNALVALAGVYKIDGQTERAIATYERAIGAEPRNPVGLSALARLLSERGDKAAARARFEQALPEIKDTAEREQLLRTLLALTLDLKDYDAAKRYHKELVQRAKGSFFVRGELARELLARGAYDRAVEEYKTLVQAAVGDNRALAPALRDYGRALAKLGKPSEALTQFRRALDVAGESGVKREIYESIVELYRAGERLPELIAELEKKRGGSADELRLLGSLYEETGQMEKALATYKLALARDAKDIATRLKVVRLLEVRGELDQAIAEYDALIRAAPRNPDFVFQLAEALIQRGDRQKALEHLKKLEARSGNDEETLTALVDFYERVEEKERARTLLQKLANMGSADPNHLVELGSRYWEEGDKKKALTTWQRIKVVVPDRARALMTLGELYLEHDMPREALSALQEAVKLQPKQARYKKAYALALERTGASAGSREARQLQYDEARKIWEQLLKDAGKDAHLAREARQHIVTLWSLSGQLAQRTAPLERRVAQNPPDVEAGRLLAEAHLRLRRYADAERVLRRIVSAAPGDVESLTALERVLVLEKKLRDAIKTLEKLVAADPKRAREYYQRMASYAAELYQDDEAVRYAARAVELSPDDAEGHKKLGEMYRQRQETNRAISEFRQALSKNERLFPVYLTLAELLLSQGNIEEADMLLRRVVRASPDEELVSQAARLSMQVNLGRGTLDSLEKDLLPLSLSNPQKPIYRQLLVEIYGALAYPLLQRARSDNPAEAEKAHEALVKLGERAVKPLLDALSDSREAQQQVAITLLQHVQNKSAGAALFAYAQGTADPELRTRAMIAVGSLRDPALIPRYTELLTPGGVARADESDPVVVAAAWGVARLQVPQARALLLKLMQSDAPSIRALSVLGLALLGETRSAPEITRIARAMDAGPMPRAAAAFAIGEFALEREAGTLAELAETRDSSLRAIAILALARLRGETAPLAISEALLSSEPVLREAGLSAALVHATNMYRKPREALIVPEGRVDVRLIMDGLRPRGYSAKEHVEALVKLEPALVAASIAAVQSSPERARAVAELLTHRADQLPFAAILRDLAEISANERSRLTRMADNVAAQIVPAFSALARHPATEVRIFAIRFLATRTEPAARTAFMAALRDSDPQVRRTALAGVTAGQADVLKPVMALLTSEQDWAMRAGAAEALGRVAAGSRDREVFQALARAATEDSYALVRESALKALPDVNPEQARPVLQRVHDTDPEPRVKALAKALLAKVR